MLVLLILTWSKPAIGTGFVSPDDLPQSDEEDEEQAVFASVKLQSNFLTFWHPIQSNPYTIMINYVFLQHGLSVQVQSAPVPASSQRHVGFGEDRVSFHEQSSLSSHALTCMK